MNLSAADRKYFKGGKIICTGEISVLWYWKYLTSIFLWVPTKPALHLVLVFNVMWINTNAWGFGILLLKSLYMQMAGCCFCLCFQWLLKKFIVKDCLEGCMLDKWCIFRDIKEETLLSLMEEHYLYSDPCGFVTGLGLYYWKINIFCLITKKISLAFTCFSFNTPFWGIWQLKIFWKQIQNLVLSWWE